MKRFLVFLCLLVLLGSGGAAWWYLRDTPEKVLRDTVIALQHVRTIPDAVLDVAWLNAATRSTTGFTASMQLDVKDLSLPKALGVLRIGAQAGQNQDQILDVAFDGNALVIRPQDVSPEWFAYYQGLVQTTSSQPFVKILREPFLKKFDYASAISKEKDAELRALLPSLGPTLYAVSELETNTVDGQKQVSLSFRFLRDGLQPLLIALGKAWKGTIPLTAKEYAWLERVTDDMLAGDFRVTLDASTRQLVRLEGSWPDIEQNADTGGDVRFRLDFSQVNGKVTIVLPSDAKDVTGLIAPGSVPTALPNAVGKEGYVASSSTQVETPSYPRDTDAFSRYYDVMKKKGLIKGAVKPKK